MSLPQAKMPVDNPYFVMSWYGDCFERVDINFEPCVSIIPQELQALGNRSAIVKSVRDREELLTAELNDVLKLGARYVRLTKGLTYLQDISTSVSINLHDSDIDWQIVAHECTSKNISVWKETQYMTLEFFSKRLKHGCGLL